MPWQNAVQVGGPRTGRAAEPEHGLFAAQAGDQEFGKRQFHRAQLGVVDVLQGFRQGAQHAGENVIDARPGP